MRYTRFLRRTLTLLLSLALLFTLCACGQGGETSSATPETVSSAASSALPGGSPDVQSPSSATPADTTPADSAAAPSASAAASSNPAANNAAVQGESGSALTAPDVSRLATFLNNMQNNGFLLDSYSRPQDINLGDVLYNGAGIEVYFDNMSTSEQADVLKWFGDNVNKPYKLEKSSIDAYIQRETGIPLSAVTKGMDAYSEFTYEAKYDAYYYGHTDSNYASIVITGGSVNRDGLYVVNYSFSDEQASTGGKGNCTVTLKEIDTSGDDVQYQFISNIKN